MSVSSGRIHAAPASIAPGHPSSRHRMWVLLALLGSLVIYGAGAAPTVLDGDSAELQTVALTGGVAHTTGYPIFAMVGWVFTHLLPGDPAFRVNLMSSVFGAACVAQIVVIGLELGFAGPVAFAAAVLYGAGFAFWAAALRAEVYTISTFIFLLAYWRTLVAFRTGDRGHRLLAAFLLGLSLAGQLSCAPAVGVLGIALAWDAFRHRGGLREVWVLPVACLAGCTPYFYTAWADANAVGQDYLRTVVDPAFFPATGVPDFHFNKEWQRLLWLLIGRNAVPGSQESTSLYAVARNVYNGGARLMLFELGPVATLLLVPGLKRLWTRRPDEVARMVPLVVLSQLFAAHVVAGGMNAIFMLYALAPLALVAALGLEWAVARWSDRGAAWSRKAVLVPALAVFAMAVPHALRVWAYEHPIPPGRWQGLGEDSTRPFYLLWRFHDPYEFRDFGRAAIRAIPESSLVVGTWRDISVLYYYRYVEHSRPDLALHFNGSYPRYLVRVRVWQEQHDLARRPVVFLTLFPELSPHIVGADSLDISRGHRLYLFHEPFRGLPAGDGNVFEQ